MNLEIYKYLNEYIQKKFPRYYEAVDRAEFVKNIASNSLLKGQDKDKILSGNMDMVIDKLVHGYARLKLTDIWQSTFLQYVSEYIQRKFPIYYNFISKDEFNSFVRSIASNTDLTDHGLDEILIGNTNKIIDELVEEYTETNMPDIKERIGSLKRYIIEVIGLNTRFKDSSILLEKIAMKIALENSDIISASELTSDRNDSEIFNKYLIIRSNYKEKLFNYIKEVVLPSGKKIGFSDDSIEKIINDMADFMLQNYGKGSMLKPEWLRKCFEKCCQVIEEKVRKHVEKVVTDVLNSTDVMIQVSARQVISDIVMMATVRGEISATKIVNGEKNGFIRSYINSKRLANEEQKKADLARALALEHIVNFLADESNEEITYGELENFASEVYTNLRNRNFADANILNCECDGIIKTLYLERYHPSIVDINRERMRENSVNSKNKKNNNSIFSVGLAIKRKIQQELAKILIVTVLGSVGGYAAGNYINRREDMESAAIVQEMDDTNYSIDNFSERSRERSYERGVNGVIQCYNDYIPYGEDYAYLCLYNAYSSGLSLKEMDNLLKNVRIFCATNDVTNGLQGLVNDTVCFYDYVYDCLINMGCEEIKQDRYLDALISYKQSYYGNKYGITSDYHIYANDEKALEDMIKLYEKYNFKYQVELGEKMENQELEADTSYGNTGIKRGV